MATPTAIAIRRADAMDRIHQLNAELAENLEVELGEIPTRNPDPAMLQALTLEAFADALDAITGAVRERITNPEVEAAKLQERAETAEAALAEAIERAEKAEAILEDLAKVIPDPPEPAEVEPEPEPEPKPAKAKAGEKA